MLKQDKTEAVMAVNSRLEYIEKEMYVEELVTSPGRSLTLYSQRIEKSIKDIQEKAEKVKMDIIQTQQAAQQTQQAAVAA